MLYQEDARVAELRATGLLDTAPDERLERVATVVRRLFDVPIALVSLVAEDRQWFKTVQGLEEDQTDRCVAFCDHTIRRKGTFVVEDARVDDRFRDNALVTAAPRLRFYAGHPLMGPGGQPIGTFCILDRRPRSLTDEEARLFRDLARWAQVELDALVGHALDPDQYREAIKESNAFLSAVLDTLPSELVILDGEGTILAGNRAWGAFSESNQGPQPYEYIGTSYLEPSKGDPEAYEGLQAVISGSRPSFRYEYPCHGPDGENRYFEMLATRINWGGPTRILIRHDNITEAKEREALELVAARNEVARDASLRETEQHRRILNAVGHHLRTPLTPLKMRLSTVRRHAPDASEAVDKALADLNRLEETVERVTRAVRIESITKLEVEDHDWETLGEQLSQIIRSRHPEAEFQIRIEGAGVVSLDGECLRRATQELVDNAVREQPEGRPIEVRFHLGTSAEVWVRDHGPGIDKEILDHLDQPFSGRTGHEDRGLGLGLYMAARIARLHGGSLIGARMDDGTMIRISIPRKASSPSS